MQSPFGADADQKYMAQALKQAKCAYAIQEVPIGAIIVDKNGTIIGRGYNQAEKLHTQTAHAELLAIKKAGQKIGDWRLTDCWLYVTLEPCVMCMACIRLSRLAGIVYGASSPLFGFSLDNITDSRVYKKDTLIVPGVCEQEGMTMLKEFFQQQRKRKDKCHDT